ncbi:MAG: hypothetical protein WC595_05110 [Candidatus Nanoarchaeia archaeon]
MPKEGMKPHLIEFWPYLTENPERIRLEIDPTFVKVGSEEVPAGLEEVVVEGLTPAMRSDADQLWSEGLLKNSKMTNGSKVVIKNIPEDGGSVRLHNSNYKSSFWLKKRASEYPFEAQRELARYFAILNIGMVSVTSDDLILMQQRPDNVTAPLMLLTYPAGFAEKEHKTVADTVNEESDEEMGFPILDAQGKLYSKIKSLTPLGLQRESDEWTPSYVYTVKLNVPRSEIGKTEEVKNIVTLPADPHCLIEAIVEKYSPTTKGDEVRNRLVPNATGMLALYIRSVAGEQGYVNLVDKLTEVSKKQGRTLEMRNYTVLTNPFR